MKLPTDPSKRRVVVAVSENKVHECGSVIETSGAAILPLPAEPEDELGRRVADSNRLSGHQILVQSPYYQDNYAVLSDAEDLFVREKHEVFGRICQLLGATKYEATDVHEEKKSDHTKTGANVKGAAYSLGVQGNREVSEADRAKWSSEGKFKGGPPQIDEAKALLRARGLEGDPTLRGLIDACTGSNPIQDYTFELDLLRETSKHLSIAASLMVPQAMTTIKANWENNLSQRTQYKVRMRV